MLLRVDGSSPIALYEQIAAGIRRAIADDTVARGERLPPAKELAASLDVNMHTVLRAYSDLREEGLIELRRGRGAIVRAGRTGSAGIHHLVSGLAEEAQRQGVGLAEVIEMLEKEYS